MTQLAANREETTQTCQQASDKTDRGGSPASEHRVRLWPVRPSIDRGRGEGTAKGRAFMDAGVLEPAAIDLQEFHRVAYHNRSPSNRKIYIRYESSIIL